MGAERRRRKEIKNGASYALGRRRFQLQGGSAAGRDDYLQAEKIDMCEDAEKVVNFQGVEYPLSFPRTPRPRVSSWPSALANWRRAPSKPCQGRNHRPDGSQMDQPGGILLQASKVYQGRHRNFFQVDAHSGSGFQAQKARSVLIFSLFHILFPFNSLLKCRPTDGSSQGGMPLNRWRSRSVATSKTQLVSDFRTLRKHDCPRVRHPITHRRRHRGWHSLIVALQFFENVIFPGGHSARLRNAPCCWCCRILRQCSGRRCSRKKSCPR